MVTVNGRTISDGTWPEGGVLCLLYLQLALYCVGDHAKSYQTDINEELMVILLELVGCRYNTM